MRSKLFSYFIVSFLPFLSLVAEEATKDSVFHQEFLFAEQVESLSKSDKQPFVTTDAQVLSVIAYTNTDFSQPWTSEKVIHIPEGWDYFNHSVQETTSLGSKKVYEPWVVRDPKNPSRIIEVHLKVEAFSRLFGRSWVGAQLDVTIVPHGTRRLLEE